jgi:hypothetical protein
MQVHAPASSADRAAMRRDHLLDEALDVCACAGHTASSLPFGGHLGGINAVLRE